MAGGARPALAAVMLCPFPVTQPMQELIAALRRAQTYSFRGRLGADPEMRFFESGTCVCNAKIAVDHPEKKGRDDGKQPDWFKLEVWGEAAQDFANQCKKGQLVDVAGRIRPETWTDRNSGEERHQLVIRVQDWSLVAVTTPAAKPAAAPATAPAPSFDDTNDDEIPF